MPTALHTALSAGPRGRRAPAASPSRISLRRPLRVSASTAAPQEARARRAPSLASPVSLNAVQEPGALASLRTPASAAGLGSQLGGSKGGGAAVLEKSGLDLGRISEVSQPKTDDGGNDGGAGGKIFNGGSGGDGDEGDDDDYFEDGDEEGDDGFLSVREVLPERFDRVTLECVLQEWFRTIADLPAGLRLAVELGLVSSAQLVRFLGVDSRPTLVRAAHRCLPPWLARAFVGRLMADPSFLAKLALEQSITLAAGVAYEAAVRGSQLGEEADLAAVSVGGQLAANAAAVCLLAPSRSFGGAAAGALGALPNHVFDASGPLRAYTPLTRAAGALAKAGQLAAVGLLMGGAVAQAQSALTAWKRRADAAYRPSQPPPPSVQHQALGSAAWLGLSCSLRYNLLAGAERWAAERLSSLSAAALLTVGARLANNVVGEAGRLRLMGLPTADSFTRVSSAISGWPAAAAAAGAGAVAVGGAAPPPQLNAEELARLRAARAARAARARRAAGAAQAPPPAAAGSGFSVKAKSVSAAQAGRARAQ